MATHSSTVAWRTQTSRDKKHTRAQTTANQKAMSGEPQGAQVRSLVSELKSHMPSLPSQKT